MAIAHVTTVAESTVTMIYIPINSFDKLSLLGGSMGLFNGFTIVAICECLYWPMLLLCRFMEHKCFAQHTYRKPLSAPSGSGYLSSTSLHGFAYLELGAGLASKAYWICIVTCALLLGFYTAFVTLRGMILQPFRRVSSLAEQTSAEMPFPTLTLCPVQIYDKWNVPRLVLNQVRQLNYAWHLCWSRSLLVILS